LRNQAPCISTNIFASTQQRSNYTQEKTHLQRYLTAIGKSGIQKYRKIEDPMHKGEFKIVTNPNYISPITQSALIRQEMQRKPNSSINIAKTRKLSIIKTTCEGAYEKSLQSTIDGKINNNYRFDP
jgi:hypothetical protein